MEPIERHPHPPDVSFDGGDLDCGNGLLLLIRRHIDPLRPGQLLEIRSRESSVQEDLPAWCRLTGNELLSWTRDGRQMSFLVCKGKFAGASPRSGAADAPAVVADPRMQVVAVTPPATLPSPSPAPPLPAFAVTGIGSWPRPRWMVQAVHERFEGRLSDPDFSATADDAVRLAVDAQLRAGVDAVTDGEQRRDNYSSFVGGILDNCQLVPLTDLLPLVDDPDEFRRELDSLDVPASEVRHPAVFGPLGRTRPIAVHELEFVRKITDRAVKVALPGPYLLARTMWMECISDRAYASREALAEDIVRVLREEVHFLLAAGASVVQLDEPVLTEVVYSAPTGGRSFMCGALSEKRAPDQELALAREWINGVVRGLPKERLAVHVCRGNWTRDESAALAGDYRPLVPLLRELEVGTLFLELCTPRAGEMEVLAGLREDQRLGVGVVNQKHERVETVAEIVERGERAVRLLGSERVLLNPDCGFATFADNPVASAQVAEAKLRAIAEAARVLRDRHALR